MLSTSTRQPRVEALADAWPFAVEERVGDGIAQRAILLPRVLADHSILPCAEPLDRRLRAQVLVAGVEIDGAHAALVEGMAQRIYHLISSRLPADLAVRMLLKPMLLPAKVEGLIRTPISKLATRVMSY